MISIIDNYIWLLFFTLPDHLPNPQFGYLNHLLAILTRILANHSCFRQWAIIPNLSFIITRFFKSFNSKLLFPLFYILRQQILPILYPIRPLLYIRSLAGMGFIKFWNNKRDVGHPLQTGHFCAAGKR